MEEKQVQTEKELLKQAIYNREHTGCTTDEELRVLLKHYTALVKLLEFHGERYHLVWFDAFNKLEQYRSYHRSRNRDGDRLDYDINGEFISRRNGTKKL